MDKEYSKKKCAEYRERNRDLLRQKAIEYYYKNRGKVLERSEKYRKANKGKISQREALRRLNDPERFEKNREKYKKWRQKNRAHLNEYARKWYHQNKEKRRANVILSRGIKKGIIKRNPMCEKCGNLARTDGHHENYSEPLQVIWLCRPCHSRKSPRTVIKERFISIT